VIEYAQVIKMLGNGRLEAMCFDGEKRLAHIRGKLRKKVWINNGDMYERTKPDILIPCHSGMNAPKLTARPLPL